MGLTQLSFKSAAVVVLKKKVSHIVFGQLSSMC